MCWSVCLQWLKSRTTILNLSLVIISIPRGSLFISHSFKLIYLLVCCLYWLFRAVCSLLLLIFLPSRVIPPGYQFIKFINTSKVPCYFPESGSVITLGKLSFSASTYERRTWDTYHGYSGSSFNGYRNPNERNFPSITLWSKFMRFHWSCGHYPLLI